MNKNKVFMMISLHGIIRHMLLQASLFLCVIVCSASGQDTLLQQHDTGIQAAGPLVLIARQESVFKLAVTQKVKTLLEGRGMKVAMVDIEQLAKQATENYNAVVIVNEVRAWRLAPDANKFLRHCSPAQRKKVVLISTAKGNATFTKKKGVDALTAASEMNKVSSVADDIVEKVVTIVSAQNNL